MYQQRFWNQFFLLRYRIEFYRLYLTHCRRVNLGIKIFLKLTSTSGIAGWLVWGELGVLWAVLIGASQVIEAIKQYLPYEKNVPPLKAVIAALENLFIESDLVWYNVAESELTEKEIHQAMVKIKSSNIKLEEKFLTNIEVPHYKRFINKAEITSDTYFSNY